MKTQDEIVERIRAIQNDDMFGWRCEVLLEGLDYDHAKEFVTWPSPVEWNSAIWSVTEEALRASATEYLNFAFGKAEGHRGLSANRSVEKMGEFLWMLDLDHEAFHAAPYTNYGVPQLFVAAAQLGVPLPESQDLQNMSHGLSCEPGCSMGCGT